MTQRMHVDYAVPLVALGNASRLQIAIEDASQP
jgi:hypothetical protein